MFQNKFSHVNADETKYFTAFEKFASIENSILKSVQKLDKFPTHILKQIETETRLQRSIQNRQGLRSLNIQENLHLQMMQFKRNLKPPQKMTRDKKYSRMRIKKKEHVVISKQILTSLQEQYVQAFLNLGVNTTIEAPDEATLKIIEQIKDSSTPFYVDHLLELLGFTLRKNIITDIEKRDGNEESFFKYKEMVQTIRTRVVQWIKFKEIEKTNNIKNTLYLYT